MSLPSGAVVKVTFKVVTTPASSSTLVPGGDITVTGATDADCDSAIVAELNARKATFQGQVDTLDEVLGKF